MRAWLLLLAVLATFQPIVQVASTEDITSSFIQAITPPQQPVQKLDELVYEDSGTRKTFNRKLTDVQVIQLKTALSPVIDITSLSTTSSLTTKIARTNSSPSTSTAIASIFNYKSGDSDNNILHNNSVKDNTNTDTSDNTNTAVKHYKQNKNKNHNEVHKKSVVQNHTVVTQLKLKKSVKNIENSSSLIGDKVAEISATNLEVIGAVNSEKHLEVAAAITILRKMAVNENANSTEQAKEHRKKHRHRKQEIHQKQQKHNIDALSAADRSTSMTATLPETASDSRTAAVSASSTVHQNAAAAKLAQDSMVAIATSTFKSTPESAHKSSSSTSAAYTNGNDDDEEPATYSNKEIIGEKLKPDPTTLVQIEKSLLSLFHMKRPPKIDRSKIIIPDAMNQLYAQMMGHEWGAEHVPRPGLLTNTVRSFTHIESKIDDRFPHHHRFRLYFNVSSIPAEETLKAAELQLSRDAIIHGAINAQLANRTSYQVLVYDITRVGVRGKREPSYLLLDNKMVRLNSTNTVSVDVQPAVSRWLAHPKKNYGLLIEVRTMRLLKPAPHHHVRLRRSADEPHDSWLRKQPVLYTYTDDSRHRSRSIRDVSSRSKRAGRRAHRRKNSYDICQRQPLYVDFADVGWSDWIVAPPGYDAFYCKGKCPFPLAEHMNSTNHAVVQTLVNNLNPGKVPKACCVPTELEGISMLYLNDQNTVVVKNYQDMAVVGCGCR